MEITISAALKNSCLVCGTPCRGKFCSISCSNKHWNPKTKTGTKRADALGCQLVTLDLTCEKCGKGFSVTKEHRLLYGKNIPKNCSRACANSRNHSDDTKGKIAASLTKNTVKAPKQKREPRQVRYCPRCSSVIHSKNTVYCSQDCALKHKSELVYKQFESGLKSGRIVTTNSVKKSLILIRGHVCELCLTETWQGSPIPLVLDHIDGRAKNNSVSNLRLICPNCDRLLPTYGSKNKNSDRSDRYKALRRK